MPAEYLLGRLRKVLLVMVALLVGATAWFSAYGGSAGTAVASPPKTHPARQKLTDVRFILSWLPNVQYAGLWVAQQKGWWAQAGIRMHFTPWTAAVHPETDVPERGGNTFGFQSGAALVIARSQGVPIQAVYSDTQRSVYGLMVMAKSSIHSLKDLRGKKVGYKPQELYVPDTMLAAAGLKPNEWTPVSVGFDPVVLTAGRVDADLCFLINEPIALAMKGVKTRTFPAADYGFHFYDNVLFTTTSLISRNPALVRAVVSVAARGYQWAHSHPDAAARLTVAHYFPSQQGYSASQNLQQQTMEMRRFAEFSRDSNGNFYGLMNTAQWRASINTLFKYKEISSRPDPASMYTNRFNPFNK